MAPPLLEAEDLTVHYSTGDEPVVGVSDVSFTIEEGDFFGFVGESGCGKTTLAKSIIGGLDANGYVESGAIRYRGEEIQDYSEKEFNRNIRWKEISYIPQSAMDSLNPLLRMSEQAVEIGRTHTDLSKPELVERFEEMFEIVGLSRDRVNEYPHQFSKGMQQRVIIALALFLEPSLIIADEPTTALDVIMQDQVFGHLAAINDDLDTSLILITHDISLVFESCNKLSIMHSGQLAETGATTDIYDDPNHPYTILLQEAIPDVRFPDRELRIIDGYPPETRGGIDYCTFADRCPWADEDCRLSAPPLEPAVDGDAGDHLVACFRKEAVREDRQVPTGNVEP